MPNTQLIQDSISLLQSLIQTPSLSKEEDNTAEIIAAFFESKNCKVERIGNNIIVRNKFFDPTKKSILLNSHHDTVKPSPSYTLDPYEAITKDGKLFGLGSNDAGGALVSLIACFLHYNEIQDLKYNVILVASAEEEISGKGGIEMVIPSLDQVDFAIVGEPTLCKMAIAEKGLLVLDAVSKGKTGHAARNEGVNAIEIAMKDIAWLYSKPFTKVSYLLGPVHVNVTVIETENKAHNVIPDQCKFVVDIRVNELYNFDEILEQISDHCQSTFTPRSKRMRSSIIPLTHELVQNGISMGLEYYGSPTTSDKALMPFPALKLGPGDSARSHTADEFIYLKEIEQGIDCYIQIIEKLILSK